MRISFLVSSFPASAKNLGSVDLSQVRIKAEGSQNSTTKFTIMKRRNNQKKQNKKQTNNNVLITSNISLNRSLVAVNVMNTSLLYHYTGSNNVSFNSGSDIRYLDFATIVAGTFPFVDLALVYTDYKILSASVTITPYSNTVSILPPMHVGCDPDAPIATNPTNSTLIVSPVAKDFSLNQIEPKIAKFTFPGVGRNVRIWTDTSISPTGAFHFGMNTTSLTGNNALIYEVSASLNIAFRNVKSG